MKHISPKKLKPNPKNPFPVKSEAAFRKLVDNIRKFPKMMEVRPIVCTPEMMVLGGNKRLAAALELGLKSVPVAIVEDWSDKDMEHFIVSDNVGYGEWDWDILAQDFGLGELQDWGLDVPVFGEADAEGQPLASRPELGGKCFYDVTGGRFRFNEYLKAANATILPGFQLRYIKLLSKDAKLACENIPFSRIAELGATMYKGKKHARKA